MTEPQVWVLIGVFATALFGMLTLMSTMFIRILRAEIGGVRAEIGGIRGEITALHKRIDRLDADVNALMRRAFGIDRD